MKAIMHPSDPGTGSKALNKRCGPHAVGAPKSTTDGADTGRDATNATPIGHHTRMESPNSQSQSRNKS